MPKHRKILRHSSLNRSQQTIVDGCSVSKKTVNSVLKKAKATRRQWKLRVEVIYAHTDVVKSNIEDDILGTVGLIALFLPQLINTLWSSL